MNMVEHVGNNRDNQHNQHNQHNQYDQHKGNETSNIPQPPTMKGLYRMIHQLQDQNRKLLAQMAMMNQKNNRRENEASSHRNIDDPTRDIEEDNTHNTCGRKETYQTTITQGLLKYSGPFSEFIMFVALLENFKLLMTLKPYDGIGDP